MNLVNTDLLDARTGGHKYDIYNYTSLGISYKFGGNSSKQKKEGASVSKGAKIVIGIILFSLVWYLFADPSGSTQWQTE